MNSGRLF